MNQPDPISEHMPLKRDLLFICSFLDQNYTLSKCLLTDVGESAFSANGLPLPLL